MGLKPLPSWAERDPSKRAVFVVDKKGRVVATMSGEAYHLSREQTSRIVKRARRKHHGRRVHIDVKIEKKEVSTSEKEIPSQEEIRKKLDIPESDRGIYVPIDYVEQAWKGRDWTKASPLRKGEVSALVKKNGEVYRITTRVSVPEKSREETAREIKREKMKKRVLSESTEKRATLEVATALTSKENPLGLKSIYIRGKYGLKKTGLAIKGLYGLVSGRKDIYREARAGYHIASRLEREELAGTIASGIIEVSEKPLTRTVLESPVTQNVVVPMLVGAGAGVIGGVASKARIVTRAGRIVKAGRGVSRAVRIAGVGLATADVGLSTIPRLARGEYEEAFIGAGLSATRISSAVIGFKAGYSSTIRAIGDREIWIGATPSRKGVQVLRHIPREYFSSRSAISDLREQRVISTEGRGEEYLRYEARRVAGRYYMNEKPGEIGGVRHVLSSEYYARSIDTLGARVRLDKEHEALISFKGHSLAVKDLELSSVSHYLSSGEVSVKVFKKGRLIGVKSFRVIDTGVSQRISSNLYESFTGGVTSEGFTESYGLSRIKEDIIHSWIRTSMPIAPDLDYPPRIWIEKTPSGFKPTSGGVSTSSGGVSTETVTRTTHQVLQQGLRSAYELLGVRQTNRVFITSPIVSTSDLSLIQRKTGKHRQVQERRIRVVPITVSKESLDTGLMLGLEISPSITKPFQDTKQTPIQRTIPIIDIDIKTPQEPDQATSTVTSISKASRILTTPSTPRISIPKIPTIIPPGIRLPTLSSLGIGKKKKKVVGGLRIAEYTPTLGAILKGKTARIDLEKATKKIWSGFEERPLPAQWLKKKKKKKKKGRKR